MSKLEHWLSIAHPEILAEFNEANAKDEYFSDLPPSQAYIDTKKEVDDLIQESGITFEQRPWNEEYPYDIGYYHNYDLVFKFCMTVIECGHKPRITYWDDYTKYTNEKKQSICFNRGDCHESTSHSKIIAGVKHVIKQIKEREAQ